MANWKQLLQPPAGALPANVVTKAGIGAVVVLMTALVLSQLMTGGEDTEADAGAGVEAGVVGQGMLGSLQARLGQLQEQRLLDQARRAREEQRAAAEAAAAAAAVTPLAALPPPVAGVASAPGIAPGQPPPLLTAGEVELQERLRLEAMERRTRSLRTPGVVQTFRNEELGAAGAAAAVAPRTPPQQASAAPGVGPAPDAGAVLEQMEQMQQAQLAALGAAGSGISAPPARTVPGVTGPEVEATPDPVRVTTPEDPAGWERVYEGSLISGVLVTQLSGEFAGPVLAQVSIPFYSADRQRILIPRGARLLGTAQAVQSRDQSRLAVGFHRLVWPDGRWVDLAFHGLNQVGESALGDQVNRHYWSMFGAAGAVGLLSGLTLQGANPYAGGQAGFQAGAGQGFGQSATQIMNRFLNRLPTITIRAGHRLRVWVTSDFLVPRPAPHPERMFR